jgi:uncharacterized protein (TIGR02246 family)
MNRRRSTLALSLLALIGAAPAPAGPGDDALARARSESEAFVKAFNEHDAKAVGALFADSADFTFLQGPSFETLQFGLISGRDQITEYLRIFFEIYPDAKLSHSPQRARLITPDVLISDEDFEISGLPKGDGPMRGQCVVIRVKDHGSWKIAAERNVSKVPPRKP